MRMVPATCQCGEEFLREPHDNYPRCSECFLEHDAPALKILTDQVSTEEQRGPIRQEENRAATTETHQQEGSVMSDSTAPEFWGYSTEYSDPFADEATAHQHSLKRQGTKRVRHTSGPTLEREDYIDFHLYRHSTDGEEIAGKTLVAVDATSGQWLAQLLLTPSNIKELAAWLTEEATR